MPDVIRALQHSHADRLRGRGGIVEQAEVYTRGVFREQSEVHSVSGDGSAQRVGPALPDFQGVHSREIAASIRNYSTARSCQLSAAVLWRKNPRVARLQSEARSMSPRIPTEPKSHPIASLVRPTVSVV